MRRIRPAYVMSKRGREAWAPPLPGGVARLVASQSAPSRGMAAHAQLAGAEEREPLFEEHPELGLRTALQEHVPMRALRFEGPECCAVRLRRRSGIPTSREAQPRRPSPRRTGGRSGTRRRPACARRRPRLRRSPVNSRRSSCRAMSALPWVVPFVRSRPFYSPAGPQLDGQPANRAPPGRAFAAGTPSPFRIIPIMHIMSIRASRIQAARFPASSPPSPAVLRPPVVSLPIRHSTPSTTSARKRASL